MPRDRGRGKYITDQIGPSAAPRQAWHKVLVSLVSPSARKAQISIQWRKSSPVRTRLIASRTGTRADYFYELASASCHE